MKGRQPWRVGRKVGRTIYDADDVLIGVMDTPELAAAVVQALTDEAFGVEDESALHAARTEAVAHYLEIAPEQGDYSKRQHCLGLATGVVATIESLEGKR